MKAEIDWFRRPTDTDPGTLNACYNALDRHVIRGHADRVAVLDGGSSRTVAWLLTEVGACAGVLQAFGVTVGDEVVVLDVPPLEATVLELACARVGAVVFRAPSTTPKLVVVGSRGERDLGDAPVISIDDSAELDWPTAMRAGRTDPAGCADLPADSALRVIDGVAVPLAPHLLAVAAGELVDPILTPLIAGEALVLEAQS